jgi:hypothetical protein
MAAASEARSTKGRIVAALLSSPSIGADLDLRRNRTRIGLPVFDNFDPLIEMDH